ncbi:hypothetical protein GSI_12011 [Ganoderma sinense ZZ0214-1]|uniref:Uncharacterized protein n=1 Tax=Ganoderma sinense ZZ0214-1 TaxID=1077348 RepID=A0A2G8RXL1_9APHY|nr:hypothetical protein GSI_12011 [Ganoderma sinense ZZ0214-1]
MDWTPFVRREWGTHTPASDDSPLPTLPNPAESPSRITALLPPTLLPSTTPTLRPHEKHTHNDPDTGVSLLQAPTGRFIQHSASLLMSAARALPTLCSTLPPCPLPLDFPILTCTCIHSLWIFSRIRLTLMYYTTIRAPPPPPPASLLQPRTCQWTRARCPSTGLPGASVDFWPPSPRPHIFLVIAH